MADDVVKNALHDELRDLRDVVVRKLDGPSEYELRRPLTPTGTNLLGLIKHLSIWESIYFGQIFDRPYPVALLTPEPGAHLWATEHETSDAIVEQFRQVALHADATIAALDLDATGHVAWWPRPDVTLLNVLVHRIAETARHAGHLDIMREQLDGATGDNDRPEHDAAYWAKQCEQIESAARAASATAGACETGRSV